ncbi:hypothetical protein EFB08_02555 [Rufibacter latericius]|uniref:Uncharacterized protein n=1 Tax=Rufibacter latericius TaxID=2487040 RepID=A0A3M9N2N4_9BACT|nr:hypothetical protein EFB08_02555 [Rufibacter latericius]
MEKALYLFVLVVHQIKDSGTSQFRACFPKKDLKLIYFILSQALLQKEEINPVTLPQSFQHSFIGQSPILEVR